jgi:dipeptidyl aminopeptidase/acylaminoacyl peptidase
LLLPEFRGPNSRKSPEPLKTCGSRFARQDIKDAIDYVLEHENVDADNILLMGYSGGGMMALLMAGMIPEYFRAVGAFVPITDLAKWHDQNEKYRPALMACTGGTLEELQDRSPITYLDTIAKANVKIFHGKFDPTVPVAQSLTFYDAMMKKHPEARLFLDVFDGAHQVDMPSGMHWIMTQYLGTKKIDVTG